MARRAPLVRIAGVTKELPASDTINAFFDGAAVIPAITLLVGGTKSVFTVTPRQLGDKLNPGDVIWVTPATALTTGLNIAYAIVVAVNQVEIGFTSTIALGGNTVAFAIAAPR